MRELGEMNTLLELTFEALSARFEAGDSKIRKEIRDFSKCWVGEEQGGTPHSVSRMRLVIRAPAGGSFGGLDVHTHHLVGQPVTPVLLTLRPGGGSKVT